MQRAIELKLDGIAFTEHYSYESSEPVEQLREKYGDSFLILRGVEFSTAEGHCLIFGVDTDRFALKYAPASEVIEAVNRMDGVVIPSHPYRMGHSLGDLVLLMDGIHAIEGYNGANMHAMNSRAVEAAEARGLPFTGGSDAHSAREVGSCYTEFGGRVTYENFLDLLRRGDYHGVETRRMSRMWIPGQRIDSWFMP